MFSNLVSLLTRLSGAYYKNIIAGTFTMFLLVKDGRQKVVSCNGAGLYGTQLLNALNSINNNLVVAFIDDDSKLVGRNINGVPILSSKSLEKN